MHGRARSVVQALLACLLAASGAAAAERIPLSVRLDHRGYEVIARKQGVVVYQHRDSDIIRLGAEAVFEAPPEQVRAALLDYQGQEGKVARVSEVRVLECDRAHLLVYQRLNLPVISDRDYVLNVRWGARDGVEWITFDAVTDAGPPPRKGVVRVTRHSGSWQLKPLADGRATFVRFQVTIDMGGSLPKWLARSGSGKEIPRLFAAIRRMVARAGEGRGTCS